jgi:hypothetical protein
MNRVVRTAANQARGFDCNCALTSASVRAFRDQGYGFVIRYVRRGPQHPYDLTPAEVATILSAGVGLMAVQHVESAVSWQPTPAKGDAYGGAAVAHARELALPDGAPLWCDLEGVTERTPEDDVVAYVNGWYDVVSTAGYLPGLYIGWHAGLERGRALSPAPHAALLGRVQSRQRRDARRARRADAAVGEAAEGRA